MVEGHIGHYGSVVCMFSPIENHRVWLEMEGEADELLGLYARNHPPQW